MVEPEEKETLLDLAHYNSGGKALTVRTAIWRCADFSVENVSI